MSTISDVARLSGLSVSTVSRVINNHPYVSKEKRKKVEEAMEKLSYVPNHAARKMRGGGTTSIGVIVKRIVNPFFSYLVDAIECYAYKYGYQVVIFQSNDNPQKEISYLELMKTKQIDGMIMASLTNEWEQIEPYTVYGPIIAVNEYDPKAELPVIRLDQMNAVYSAVKYLIDKGHKKIAYCSGGLFQDNQELCSERDIGYKNTIEEAKLELNPEWIFLNRLTIEDGKQIARQIVEMDAPPTAIFANGDEIASGIVMEVRKNGIKVPEDLAVVGFDDQPFAELIEPPLTTIRQPIKEMGETAAAMIIKLLEKKGIESREIILPYELVVRQST